MTDNTEDIKKIDTGLACFAIMANFFEKPISIDQIKHKYDRQDSNFEECELLQLAKDFSLKAKFVETSWERLSKTNLPAIAQSKDGKYFIIGQVSEDKILIQNPEIGNRPQVLSKEEFLDLWNGRLLMMTAIALCVSGGVYVNEILASNTSDIIESESQNLFFDEQAYMIF